MSRPPEHLTFAQAVRKRPAMYVGSTSIRGFYFLLGHLVRYALTVANSDIFVFEIQDTNSGRITFEISDGPMDENVFTDPRHHEWSCRSVADEIAVFNALCSTFQVRQTNLLSGDSRELRFAMGFQAAASGDLPFRGAYRVEIEFKLDDSIFPKVDRFDWNLLLEIFRTFAYLYRAKTLRLIYGTNGDSGDAILRFDGGLSDLVSLQRLYEHSDPMFKMDLDLAFEDFSIDLALHFRGNSVDMPYLISFVNEERSMEDGTHVEGALKGLLAALLHYQRESDGLPDRKITVDGIVRLLVAAVHLRMERPQFEGSIRGKVISRNIIGPISNHVGEAFLARLRAEPELADDLVMTVSRLSES